MTTYDVTVQLVLVSCCVGTCGMIFGVPSAWRDARKSEHSTWCCPNGHHQYFPGETDEEKLRRKVAELQGNYNYMRESRDRYRRDVETAERSLRAQKAANTRLRRRVTNGVCPCCQRHFANVERHMKSQHPDQVQPPSSEG